MSGHSHFSSIKHKKGVADQKRGQLFAKLLNAISIAARSEQNPQFNPHLRSAIEKARQQNVPQDKIKGAINRAAKNSRDLEELILEAYGPEGTAILIEVITNNKNRVVAEIKKILNDHTAKWARTGSVRWAFDKIADSRRLNADIRGQDVNSHKNGAGWQAKFKQEISSEAKNKLQRLVQELEQHEDVQRVYTNT